MQEIVQKDEEQDGILPKSGVAVPNTGRFMGKMYLWI
jgi:hypothetical protein